MGGSSYAKVWPPFLMVLTMAFAVQVPRAATSKSVRPALLAQGWDVSYFTQYSELMIVVLRHKRSSIEMLGNPDLEA
jgi:hypothetical protein